MCKRNEFSYQANKNPPSAGRISFLIQCTYRRKFDFEKTFTPTRWTDVLKKTVGTHWIQMAQESQDRIECRKLEEASVQQ